MRRRPITFLLTALVLPAAACNGDATTPPPADGGGGGAGDQAIPFVDPDLAATPGELGAPDCGNGVMDGDETDVDCGGSCSDCTEGRMCAVNEDCTSGSCTMGRCGGPACRFNADCITRLCRAGVCVMPPGTPLAFGAPVETVFEVKTLNIAQPAIADFNGDGKADVAVVDGVGDSLTVFNGRGDGTLAVPTVYASGRMPTGVVAWDFNNDKRPDLAILNEVHYSVMLANQNGFDARMENAILNVQPNSMIAGDFDRDGNGDLVLSQSNGNVVRLFRGNGKGQFQGMDIAQLTANHPAAADINGDGKLDLALASQNSTRVLLQSNNLVFAESWRGPDGVQGLDWLQLADLDGDGHPDLVENSGLGLRTYTGDGKGGFKLNLDLGKSFWPGAIVAADFNVDGWMDLVVMSAQNSNLQVFPGNGAGVFNPAWTIAVGRVRDDGLAVGDLNRDGKPDIVCFVLGQNDRRLSVILNTAH